VLIKLLPVSNKDNLELKSLALDFISFYVIIFVATGIEIRSESVYFSSTFCLEIVLSVVENIFNIITPPVCRHTIKEPIQKQ
jgi:hypothetical protein